MPEEMNTAAGPKERTIYVLKTLTELVENDAIELDEIQNMTAAEIIERAELEAEKNIRR